MNALDTYIDNLDALIRSLSPAEQQGLMRKIGTAIRQNNKIRIKANIAPDGAAFKPRTGIPSQPSRRIGIEQEFLYRGRLRRFRTLHDYGSHYIGWEYHTRHTFKALKDQIRRPVATAKQKLMFRKINQYKYLKMKAESHQAAIGFLGGLVGYIAAAHQSGEDSRPERHLLGLSDEDLHLIEQMLIQHLSAV